MRAKRYLYHALILMALVVACSEMDDFKEFQKGGEIIYTGKADSVQIHSGRNRIGISMQLVDPKVSKVVVYWNSMKDSLVTAIVNEPGIDLVDIIIPDLAAGSYNFVIYTYDAKGNKSVPVNVSGRVYGDVYESGLLNRPIKKAYRWNDASPLFIVWEPIDAAVTTDLPVGVRIVYTDNNGAEHLDTVEFENSRDTTVFILPGNLNNSQIDIEYSTMIKPDSSALDLFFAASESFVYTYVPLEVIKAVGDVSGAINVTAANSTIDKQSLTFTKTVDISRFSLPKNIGYSTEVTLSTTGIPGGTDAIDLNDVTMTDTNGDPVSVLEVPSGQSLAQLNFTIPKSVLDANPDKKVAFKINFSNLATSGFTLDGLVYSVSLVIDVNAFVVVNDVTATYFKNAGGAPNYFERTDAASTDRWGIAKDWIASANVLNVYGNTKGGIDKWPGYNCLNMVRWGTPQILDGKLYQTFSLPKGRYEFSVDYETTRVFNAPNSLYLVVADGADLPNTSDVATSIAYSSYSTSKVVFTLSEDKTVSIGFLAYLVDDTQEFRARQVKLKELIGAFD